MAARPLSQFFSELKRRKVHRAAAAYAVIAWLLVEVAATVFPELFLPEWSVRLVIVLAIVGFPVALIIAWTFDLTPHGLRADRGASPQTATGVAYAPVGAVQSDGRRSIAVLPLVNLSNDPESEYFSDGMAEEILNLLCKLPQLSVASRTSSFSFKNQEVDLGTIARKLGVDVLLEGSVRRDAGRVRIAAQLIDGHSDRHLWSEVYDRELEDVFAVQDEIARSIVRTLEIKLTPAQQRSIQKTPTTGDMDAYDFYLRGRYFFERGDVDYAQDLFQQAIEQDPEYALAWAGAADSRVWMCMWRQKTRENLQAADAYSRKAVQLAPELAEARASRGFALSMNGNFDEAEVEYKLAMELDPQLFQSYYYAGRAYFEQGELRNAADMFARAAEIRPDDVSAATLRSTSLRPVGTEEEIREAAAHAVAVSRHYVALNPDDALALSRAANELIKIGSIDEGLAWAERAYAISPDITAYNVACAFVSAEKIERALDILEECLRSNTLHWDWLVQDSDWDAARDHPRFKAVLESLS